MRRRNDDLVFRKLYTLIRVDENILNTVSQLNKFPLNFFVATSCRDKSADSGRLYMRYKRTALTCILDVRL